MPTVVGGREGYETPDGEAMLDMAQSIGLKRHGFYQLFGHLTIGWPAYILAGLTGGSKYGTTNHLCARSHSHSRRPHPLRRVSPRPHSHMSLIVSYTRLIVSLRSWPRAPFSTALWPGKWAAKVLQSSAGVAAVVALLMAWARRAGSATVWAYYGGPYLIVNSMWRTITALLCSHVPAQQGPCAPAITLL